MLLAALFNPRGAAITLGRVDGTRVSVSQPTRRAHPPSSIILESVSQYNVSDGSMCALAGSTLCEEVDGGAQRKQPGTAASQPVRLSRPFSTLVVDSCPFSTLVVDFSTIEV